MAAALVINGSNAVTHQGSYGTSPIPGPGATSVTATGHFLHNTVAGDLLICAVNYFIYSNGSACVPTLGAPTTPGFTWILAGVITSDTETFTDPDATGGVSYETNATAVYYIANASVMASTVTTTQVTTFSIGVPSPQADGAFYGGFELTEWSGLGAEDNVVTAKGISATVDAGSIVLSDTTSANLLFVAGNIITPDQSDGTETSVGAGYTGLDNLANPYVPTVGQLGTQYKLNIASGTYATAFSAAADGALPPTPGFGAIVPWSAVAVTFGPASGGITPTPSGQQPQLFISS